MKGPTMPIEQQDEVTTFLHDFLTAIHTRHPLTPGYEYASQADLLLRAGRWFTSNGNHPGLRMGRMQFCFFNARGASRAAGLGYYEGYAISRLGLPHPHAWVVDQDGLAWDVTWPIPARQATALCGVYVPPAVLDAHWRTCGGASLLQDYYHDHPCLQHAHSAWVSELIPHLARLRERHCLAEVKAGRMFLLPDGSMSSLPS